MVENNENVEYKELLILIYLNDYVDEYMLSEIRLLCDLTTSQFTRTIEKLEKKELISSKGSLKLTDKARRYLVTNGYNEVNILKLQEDIVTLNITKPQLNFEDIYVPSDFRP